MDKLHKAFYGFFAISVIVIIYELAVIIKQLTT